MSAKHTPGPWEVTTGCFQEASHMSDGKASCRVSYSVNAIGQRGLDAPLNAALIASAPELLAALEALLATAESLRGSFEWATGLREESEAIEQAEAVIRRAKGEA